jgi:hypothetical protein
LSQTCEPRARSRGSVSMRHPDTISAGLLLT